MAKNMAKIENGAVVNILWCSDKEPEIDTLVAPGDRPVGIGDAYSDGKFYRDGGEILTPLAATRKENERLTAENAELLEAMATMVNDVYNQDVGQMEE